MCGGSLASATFTHTSRKEAHGGCDGHLQPTGSLAESGNLHTPNCLCNSCEPSARRARRLSSRLLLARIKQAIVVMKAAKEIYQKADAAGSYAGRMAFTVQKIGHLNTYPQNSRALTKDPPKTTANILRLLLLCNRRSSRGRSVPTENGQKD